MPYKQVPSLFHLFAFTALIIVIGSISSKAQCCPHIDTVNIIPNNPLISDSIQIRTVQMITTRGIKISDTMWVIADTIHLRSCFAAGWQQSTKTFVDTFSIGLLTQGTYTIKLISYESPIGTVCNPIDTASLFQAFEVIDDIGLEEVKLENGIKLELFPNPFSSLQQINLFTQIPVPLQINLHDISGQKVKQVFRRQSVQGQQKFEVDVSHLPNGVYFYRVKVGEEWQYLKTIKY
jgi:hypothetical protein